MEFVKGDNVKTPIWSGYKEITKNISMPNLNILAFCFLRAVKKAYAVIATGESALYVHHMK